MKKYDGSGRRHGTRCFVKFSVFLLYLGLIRGHDEAERLFISGNGFSYLLRALQRNVPKINVKAIFLISNLTEEKTEYLGKG